MDCEWKSIRFYGFSMDSNRPLALRSVDVQHKFGSKFYYFRSRIFYFGTTEKDPPEGLVQSGTRSDI